jgi:hypothetical protein
MRHGRKSRSVRFDGYKRHVLRDLDTGLVAAVGITAANAPEATVTDAIAADLVAQNVRLAIAVRTAESPAGWRGNVDALDWRLWLVRTYLRTLRPQGRRTDPSGHSRVTPGLMQSHLRRELAC